MGVQHSRVYPTICLKSHLNELGLLENNVEFFDDMKGDFVIVRKYL